MQPVLPDATHNAVDSWILKALERNCTKEVEPLDLFPDSSLPSPFNSILLQEILNRLEAKKYYDPNHEKEKWLGPHKPKLYSSKPDALAEEDLAKFFNEIVELSLAKARRKRPGQEIKRRFWGSRNRKMVGGRQYPDLVLTDDISGEFTGWKDAITTMEIKCAPTDELETSALQQLTDKAFFILSSQVERRFFMGLILCGPNLQVALFTRGGSAISQKIDISTEPLTFLRVLLSITLGHCVWLGYHHNIRLGYDGLLRITSGEKVYTIVVTLFRSTSIQGRGTRILLVRDEDSRYVIIKDCWLPDAWTKDIDIHKYLHQRTMKPHASREEEEIFGPEDKYGIFRGCEGTGEEGWEWDQETFLPGIPIMEYGEVVKTIKLRGGGDVEGGGAAMEDKGDESNLVSDTTHNLLRGLGPTPDYEALTHILVAFRTCGMPLSWFSCKREFCNAAMGIVVGHYNAWSKDVLHCDLSDTNAWMRIHNATPEDVVPDWPENAAEDWYPKRAGVLGDWGYAEDLLNRPEGPGFRTGTYTYMASQMLLDPKVQHGVHHDLESLFWVLWLITVNIAGPFHQKRQWIPIQTKYKADGEPTTVSETIYRQADDGGIDSPRIPTWATPGVHQQDTAGVGTWKSEMGNQALIMSMSPYFRNTPAIWRGLDKMRERFVPSVVYKNSPGGGRYVTEPPIPMTHKEMVDILREMRDSLTRTDDPAPTPSQIKEGRKRYQELLDSGNVETPILASVSRKRKLTLTSDSAPNPSTFSRRVIESGPKEEQNHSNKQPRMNSQRTVQQNTKDGGSSSKPTRSQCSKKALASSKHKKGKRNETAWD